MFAFSNIGLFTTTGCVRNGIGLDNGDFICKGDKRDENIQRSEFKAQSRLLMAINVTSLMLGCEKLPAE